ncbi:MAG: HTH domain-containing protein, partial [Ginsengibacter sp.]
MDQKKMQRLLRLLMLLSGNRRFTVKEILEKLECSKRTAYRYLETLEICGFFLEKHEATYRLQKGSQTSSLQKLLHFSEEDVAVLYE